MLDACFESFLDEVTMRRRNDKVNVVERGTLGQTLEKLRKVISVSTGHSYLALNKALCAN